MRTQIPPLFAHWLTESASFQEDLNLPATFEEQTEKIGLPPEVGSGIMVRLPLAPGLSILHGLHHFLPEVAGQLIQIAEFKFDLPENAFSVQTVHASTVCHREFYPPAELIFRPGHDLFRHADGFHTIPSIDASADCDMTSMIVTDSTLNELIGEDAAGLLIARLGLNPPPSVKVIAMPLHVSAPLRASMSAVLTGTIKRLYAQSKVLEYLCNLSTYVCAQPVTGARTERSREIVHDLHAYLVQLEGKLPTLDELAMRYGMSARWLNDEFSREYGMPIYTFITDHRLGEAHAALLEGNLPIKRISQRLGYSHVNHFTNGFKKKFGYTPGSLRRGRRA